MRGFRVCKATGFGRAPHGFAFPSSSLAYISWGHAMIKTLEAFQLFYFCVRKVTGFGRATQRVASVANHLAARQITRRGPSSNSTSFIP